MLRYPGHSYRGDLKVVRGDALSQGTLLSPHLHHEEHSEFHSDLEQEGDQHHVIHQPHLLPEQEDIQHEARSYSVQLGVNICILTVCGPSGRRYQDIGPRRRLS